MVSVNKWDFSGKERDYKKGVAFAQAACRVLISNPVPEFAYSKLIELRHIYKRNFESNIRTVARILKIQ